MAGERKAAGGQQWGAVLCCCAAAGWRCRALGPRSVPVPSPGPSQPSVPRASQFFLPFPGTIPIFSSWNTHVLSFPFWEPPCFFLGAIPAFSPPEHPCMFLAASQSFFSHNLPALLLAASQPFPLGASVLLPLFTPTTSLIHFFSSSLQHLPCVLRASALHLLLDPEQNMKGGKNTGLCLPSPSP